MVPHTSLTSNDPGGGRVQYVGLRDFCHNLTLMPPGHPCFTNTCLVKFEKLEQTDGAQIINISAQDL